ncbi:MAG: hypothetical protein MUO82_04870 [Candidatus Thermoplasmatota archaeon]|nr:hypothetical protein [Candidatus Thermoplasmatota archaeon]
MKKKTEDIELKKYPYLKKYLDESGDKYDLNSDEDLFNLFNIILKTINKKRMVRKDEHNKQNEQVKT